MTFQVIWKEDSTATVLGRITARNGTGTATGVRGEGNWIEQVDVDTITWKMFDLSSDSPDAEISSGELTVSAVVLDIPISANTIWTKDSVGYNFLHDVAASNFPTGNHNYRLEYTVILVGGAKFHGIYEGLAAPLRSS